MTNVSTDRSPAGRDGHSNDPEVLRAQVAMARERLGDTIEELAARADLRAQARRTTERMRGRMTPARARARARKRNGRTALPGEAAARATGDGAPGTVDDAAWVPDAEVRAQDGHVRAAGRHGGRKRWLAVAAVVAAAGVAGAVAAVRNREAMAAYRKRYCEKRWWQR